MDNIEKLFCQDGNVFTIFVVEQRFVVSQGRDYFHSYLNTPNYLDTDKKIRKNILRVVETTEQSVAPVEKLISIFRSGLSRLSIVDAITSLCKLYTVYEHQAVGPEVIDPIILQEGKISKQALTRIIHKNKDSILRPAIIVLLKDNDFDRAKKLLSECPHGINVKMIHNDGINETYQIVNCGASDINSFLDSFASQCYSTCSQTKRNILLNDDWKKDTIVEQYSPLLFKFRSSLLQDEKDDIRQELSALIETISQAHGALDGEEKIIRSFECISKLFRVFCNDAGGQDILDALELAKTIQNETLLAHVYRYAEFFPNCTESEKNEFYKEGYQIFRKNKMDDHAIYCKNNMLIQQFYTGRVRVEEFREMLEEAVNNVPGMVGLSHIYNNVGVAHLYCGNAAEAVVCFEKGLDYARYRIVQNLALESNKMIAESYSCSNVSESRMRYLLRRIFDGMGVKKMPFLSADFALNVLSVAYHQSQKFGQELLNIMPIKGLVEASFSANIMGSGERLLLLQYLDAHYGSAFPLLQNCKIPSHLTTPSGKRMDFILRYGYNPFEFNTWL